MFSDFIYPLFIQENTQGKVSSSTGKKEPIPSMPGIYCHDLTSMMQEIDESVG